MNLFDVLFAKKLSGGGSPFPPVIKRVTGNPIEFSDGADAPLVKCVTQITGSQDLHGQDKPWVGGAGKNKVDVATASVLNFSLFGGEYYSNSDAALFIFDCAPNTTYTISVLSEVTLFRIASFAGHVNQYHSDINNWHEYTQPSAVTITTTASDEHIAIQLNKLIVEGRSCLAQVELGSTATTFAPYSNICPITAYTEGEIEVSDGDGNVTTHTTTYPSAIYRGSEDVVNGTETHDTEVYSFTGNETITQAPANQYVFNVVAPTKFDLGIYHLQDTPRTWSHFNGVNYKDAVNMVDGEARQFNAGGFWYFSFCNHNLSSVSDCATWLANQAQNGTPVQIAAPLATPTTSSVTPTNLPIKSLSGYNHIESSTGDMVVDYITEGYQNFVDTVESALPNTTRNLLSASKGGMKAMDIFLSLDEPKTPEASAEENEPEEKETEEGAKR